MLSVIIPTYNNSQLLERALYSIVSQTINNKDYEILIIDNASIDNTKLISESFIFQNKHISIKYFFEPVPGLLSGRHKGYFVSSGDILVFIDDDIEADENWLISIKESFEDNSVQLVGGRSLPKFEIAPPKWVDNTWTINKETTLCGYLSLIDLGEKSKIIDANLIWGLNFSIRKTALYELGGFHPDCIPLHLQILQGDGETGLTTKANLRGYKSVYQPNALVYHYVPKSRITVEYFEKRMFYQGICDSFTSIRNERSKQKIFNSAFMKNIFIVKDLIHHTKKASNIFLNKWKMTIQDEERVLKARFNKQYQEGFLFHQQAVKNNKKLLSWVLKENYWDYRLPEL